ncbi:hypothetical protein ASF34_13085, partial [Methylobacterium sp. Leaf106]
MGRAGRRGLGLGGEIEGGGVQATGLSHTRLLRQPIEGAALHQQQAGPGIAQEGGQTRPRLGRIEGQESAPG